MTSTEAVAYVSADTVAALCDGLVSYNLVYVTGRITPTRDNSTWKLMARDYPRAERRYTNLTTGMEVFSMADFLANVNATDVIIADDKDRPFLILSITPA